MSDFVTRPIQDKLNRHNPLKRLDRIEAKQAPRPSARVNSLSDFTGATGTVIANNVIAPSVNATSEDPTSSGFIGAFMGGDPKTFDNDNWLLGTAANGQLNFGARESDGSVYTRGDYLRVIERLQGFANFNGTISALAYDATNGYIYIGGAFTKINGTTYNRIVRFNLATSTFTALSTGIANGIVYALALADDGTLYLGGTFTNAGGDANADLFAKWNGSAFSACGTAFAGASTSVDALVMASDGVTVYIGGNFVNIGDANGDYITSWNGSAYVSLATGLNGQVLAMDIDSSGNLYVGGAFTDAGGDANADKFAMWNGVAFAALGTAFGGATQSVSAISVDENDDVYITGAFTNVGDASGDYIVKWDGSAYSSLGSGIPTPIANLSTSVLALNNYVYVGGSAGGGASGSAWKRYDITNAVWETVGGGLFPGVYAMVAVGNDVYIGGGFATDASAESPMPQFVKWGAVNLKDILDYLLRSAGSSSIIMGFSTDESVNATATRYANPYTSSMRAATTTMTMPRAGYLRNWYLKTRTAQTVNNSMTVTMEVNGVAVMTIVIAAGDAAQTYSDTTTVAFVNAGDQLAVKFVNAAAVASAVVNNSSWEFL